MYCCVLCIEGSLNLVWQCKSVFLSIACLYWVSSHRTRGGDGVRQYHIECWNMPFSSFLSARKAKGIHHHVIGKMASVCFGSVQGQVWAMVCNNLDFIILVAYSQIVSFIYCFMWCWPASSLEEMLKSILSPISCLSFFFFSKAMFSCACWSVFNIWTGQSRITVSLGLGSPLAHHLQSKDGSSPGPRALLALTPGSCGCRLEQWPLTWELQTDRRCAFAVLTRLF